MCAAGLHTQRHHSVWRQKYTGLVLACIQSIQAMLMCRHQSRDLRDAVRSEGLRCGGRRGRDLRAEGLRAQEAHGVWWRICAGLQGQRGLWVSYSSAPIVDV